MGSYNTIKLLIDRVDIKDDSSSIYATDALINACKSDNLQLVRLLVEKGVDVHYDDDRALQIAVSNQNADIVNFLMDTKVRT
jgi:ankyrin repeat protein